MKRWELRILMAALAVLAVGMGVARRGPSAAASTVLVGSEPAANAVVTAMPKQLRLMFGAPLAASGHSATVNGTDGKAVVKGQPVTDPSKPAELVLALPELKNGVYTVIWNVASVDGPASGVFAFSLAPAGSTSALLKQPVPVFTLPPKARALPRWLAFISIMTAVGALAVRWFVALPVARRLPVAEARETQAALDRRLLLLAAAAAVCFVPATLAQLVWDAGVFAKLPYHSSFHFGVVKDFLTKAPAGRMWTIRLVVTALLVLVLVPPAVAALRRRWRYQPGIIHPVLGVAFVLGAAELLVRTLPVRLPDPGARLRAGFTSALDWGHMLGAAMWIGGLLALVVLALTLRRPTQQRGALWSGLIGRFSLVATVCVGIMILTGLWTTWIHVGSLGQMVSTLYGRTLLLKLGLFTLLLAMGAFHQLWVLPRLEAIRDALDPRPSYLSVLLGHFRRIVAVEAVVGVAVLLVVPFLAGSARNQELQTRAADLTQRSDAGNLALSFTPSALQPGLAGYDITVSRAQPERVAVTFTAPDLGVLPTTVEAAPTGNGNFRVTGMYTPMVGAWQAEVKVQAAGSEQTAVFKLPVRAQPVTVRATPPAVRASTWAGGIGALLVVTGFLAAAKWFSGRLSAARGATTVPATTGDSVAVEDRAPAAVG